MARRRNTSPEKPFSHNITQRKCADTETPHFGHHWSGPRGGRYQCQGNYKFVRSGTLVWDVSIKPRFKYFLAPNGDVHTIHPLAEHKIYWDIEDVLNYGQRTAELLIVPLCVGKNDLTEAQIVQAVLLLEKQEDAKECKGMAGHWIETCVYCVAAGKVWNARFGEGR